MNVDTELVVGADHPAFDGHFPGAPVLPGVVLLSMTLEALAAAPALAAVLGTPLQIDQVKFLAPVFPGDRLRVALAARADGVDFSIQRGVDAVARGRLSHLPTA